jgi:membrane protein implicated in regulation of membrane protease activity
MSIPAYWLVAALLLAGLEMLSGTFYLLAIASGLACGGLAAWLGADPSIQMICAALVSLAAVVLLHHWKKRHLPKPEANGSLEIGRRVSIDQWLDERHARVNYRGTQWDGELAEGAQSGQNHYFIVALRGTTLILHHQQAE